jgi:hypothetical protein
MASDHLSRMRAVFMAFPEVTERLSHGAPSWFVRDSKTIGNLWVNGHHDIDQAHLTCAAATGVQAELIASDPSRFFRPPYVGHRGWIGVYIDGHTDWAEIAELAEDSYRLIAPKTLVARLDAEQHE